MRFEGWRTMTTERIDKFTQEQAREALRKNPVFLAVVAEFQRRRDDAVKHFLAVDVGDVKAAAKAQERYDTLGMALGIIDTHVKQKERE